MVIKLNDYIKTLLISLPNKPGCYLMKDEFNNIIYIGKAIDLKKRVTSYFNRVHNHKTQLLVSEINTIDYMITSSEKESLILEINLIKKHRPKYNVMFMDDKYYPYIAITKERHPKLKVVRNTKMKNASYFGPFPNSGAAWQTLELLNKLFKLRKCAKLPKKECLYYHLDQCLAPCIKEVSSEEYDRYIKEIKSFLNGNTTKIIKNLNEKMIKASDDLNFEKAMDYKKLIESINLTTDKQKVFKNDMKNRDYLGIAYNDDYISIQFLLVRNGVLIERKGDIFELVDDIKESIESYIMQYYELNQLPDELYMDEQYQFQLIKDEFSNIIKISKKGNHKKMIELANENATNLLTNQYDMIVNSKYKLNKILEELKNILNLSKDIHRIEAFDNSTLSGFNSVGSMVVYEDGLPIKSEYRRFKIKDIDIKDDLSFMKEVIYRRYYRVLVDKLKITDLIIVDGGLGQIKLAKEIIDRINLKIKIIGLVKDEKHRTSYIIDDNFNKILIDKKSDLFFFITRIQDEMHKYAINYHQNIRSKSMFSSIFDDINGIGEKRKNKLLNHFKSYKRIKEASVEELENVLPHNIALELYENIHNKNN